MASSFTVNLADLNKILDQIKIAEQNAGNQDRNAGAVNVAGRDLVDIIGQDAALLPLGLRTVSGIYNHLLPGQQLVGAADQPFPRLLTPETRTGLTSGGVDFNGDGIPDFNGAPGNVNTTTGVATYNPTGSVVDSAPRTISNLIVDQSINNPAAVEAWFANPLSADAFALAHPGFTPIRPGQIAGPGELAIDNTDLSLIANQSPDIGLSPQFNGFMTFFGQFFDHGLDLVPKGGNGNVYIPLLPDDPLFSTAPGAQNFMVISRVLPNAVNITTPFIDQNQTYTSHASHQVFLREYAMDGGVPIATGHLLTGANNGLPTWAEVKAQAADLLGIQLLDKDVLSVPLLATDEYGRFIRGPNGFVQIVTATGLVEANPADNGGLGTLLPANTIPAGTAFLDDIAHDAAPKSSTGTLLTADADAFVGSSLDGQLAGTYDNELLDQHFITGDGRGNENIGLTTVHTVFHNEHDRLVEANKVTILASNDVGLINEWLAPSHQIAALPANQADIDALVWNGERLFQAARFVTEMQYQHLVFEEFARKVQPNVDPFIFTNSADLDPSIVAEFAHTVYRFGHSMLNDTVDRLDNTLNPLLDSDPTVAGTQQIGLIEAFLNPVAFSNNNDGVVGNMTAGDIALAGVDAATVGGAILRGVTRQAGNEIDEFVVNALRNNLVGLPLDLAAINMARGRDAAIPTLNHAREQLYSLSTDPQSGLIGDPQLKPYTSWIDFAQNIKHPESIINFIAAYGTHASITAETTIAGKRDAALALVFGTDADSTAFLNATGIYATARGGLDNVDLWIGGLAEELMEFGGMLGSTFGAVFEYQMEHLQNGDRFYYLSRTQGMNLLNQLEPTTFADLVMRNTDLGAADSTHISALAFNTADLILELDPTIAQNNPGLGTADPTHDSAFLQMIDPKVVRIVGGVDVDAYTRGEGVVTGTGNMLKFSGGEHVVLGGTEGRDVLIGDKGIDTLWGDGGDDYINAGTESDQVFGGEGDDIIEDPFGDNFLRGNQGNDVISSSGQGLTIQFGDMGNDFLKLGTDAGEVFAGEGDDFILGGNGADTLLGNEGDDWIEGGEGLDGIAGENSELFFNSPIIGHDVLNGQGNDTDYDGESGDDIMFLNSGITRANGMLGFDWVIKKGDPNATGSDNPNPDPIDLGVSRFANQLALTLRDRNDSVEGASGWKFDDLILGTSNPTGAVGDPAGGIVGAPITDSKLLSQNVALINGLDTLLALTPGLVRGQTVQPNNVNFATLPPDTFVFDPANGGDILLGGAGSDTIFGKAGNDIIDGDRWLNVRIEVHANRDGTGAVLQSVDSLNEISADMVAGRINPGQLRIVREIITTGAAATDQDVAVFAGARADFTITRNGNGTVTVVDTVLTPVLLQDGTPNRLLADEGTDTLSNIEIARFSNFDNNGIPNGTFTDVFIGRASGAPTITGTGTQLTASTAGIVEANGIVANSVRYQWQQSTDGINNWTNVGGNTANPNITPNNINFYRVIVSYTDNDGFAESLTSQITARVGTNGPNTLAGTTDPNLLIGRGGIDTLTGGDGSDVLVGGAGNDTLNGGDGIDTASYGDAAAAVSVSLVTNTSTGGSDNDTLTNIENLTGGTGSDTLTGNGGDNVLTGGAGNDALIGGAGNDTLDGGTNNNTGGDVMTGGDGNDTYFVNDVTGTAANVDVVIEGSGANSGTDTVVASGSYTLGDNLENLTLIGTGNFAGAGNAADNILAGNSGNNSLTGGDGTDTAVYSGSVLDYRITTTAAGVQTVVGATSGTDTLTTIERLQFGNTTYTTVVGTVAATTITGTAGGELVFGLDGNDTINSGAGDDAIVWTAGDGRDIVNGGIEGTVGDAFIVNGDANNEAFTVYARADAIAAGFGALAAGTDIVVTRTVGAGAETVLAELDEIEEIVINTGGGANDSVLVVGSFNPTDLRFNTITVNDDGGAVTVDLLGLTSMHHIELNSLDGDDFIIGQRQQDVVNSHRGSNSSQTVHCNADDDLSNAFGGSGFDTLVVHGGGPLNFDLRGHLFEAAQTIHLDLDNSQGWSELTNSYDADWLFTSQRGTYDNGASWYLKVDDTVEEVWDASTEYYDEFGRVSGNYVHRDDGTAYGTVLDSDSTQSFAYYVNYLDDAGRQTGILFQQDDGTSYGTAYDVANTASWATISNYANADGQITSVQTRYDDGSLVAINYDPANTFAWTMLTNYIDASGHLTTQDAVFDDGYLDPQDRAVGRIVSNFDVADAQPWTSETYVYDPSGVQIDHVFRF